MSIEEPFSTVFGPEVLMRQDLVIGVSANFVALHAPLPLPASSRNSFREFLSYFDAKTSGSYCKKEVCTKPIPV
jgi:hypothetical protein